MTIRTTTFVARLCGRGGELDMISADDLETLSDQLGKRVLRKDWIITDGDTIHIEQREMTDA